MKSKNGSKPRCPAYFEPEFREIWNETLNELCFSTAELATFRCGLDALRRMRQAREIVDREGLVVVSGNGTAHKHPCTEVEKNAAAAWIAAFRALGLRVDEEINRPGRPGAGKKVVHA